MNNLYCEVVFAIPNEEKYTYFLPENLSTEKLIGRRVLVNFSKQHNKVGIIVEITSHLKKDIVGKKILSINKILDTEPLFKPYQLVLAEKLAKKYLLSLGEILYQMFPFENELLFNTGIIQNKHTDNFKELIIEENIKNILSKKNYLILIQPNSIKEKFELYKNVIFYAINENKQCIIIFPENSFLEDFYSYLIKLCPNLVEKIFIYNGKKSIQERFTIWNLLYGNLINIILSTKIGIFLPCNESSLLVVDEPDNLGHKNFANPPLSTKEILEDHRLFSKVFLVSFNISINTKFAYKKNNKSIFSKISPTNITYTEKNNNLKNILIKEIYKLKQSIVIYPQKGFATFVSCSKCGKVARCEKCNSVFKYDITEKKIICQICNNKKYNFFCRNCENKYYKTFGVGIQKISDYLSFSIPEANIERLDNDLDEPVKKQIVENFNDQKIDILVTTQEILNHIYRLKFNNVSLIYFAKMELMLFRANYLAYENCYNFIKLMNLLTENKAKIYLELYKKDDNYKSLLMNEKDFYINELKIRKELCYPPFCKLIQLTFVSKNQDLKKNLESLILDLEKVDDISVFYNEELKYSTSGFKTSLLIKIFEDKVPLNKILNIIIKYKSSDIRIYVDYDPKDFL